MENTKTRTVLQIMADAEMMDRARQLHHESALSPKGRSDRLYCLRSILDPKIQNG